MNENIFGALTACQKAEALSAIEPLDDNTFQTTGRRNCNMRALRRHLRWKHSGRRIHGKNTEALHATVTIANFTNNARSFKRCLEAIAAKRSDMQQDIGKTRLVRNNEAVALCNVKPLNVAGHFNKFA